MLSLSQRFETKGVDVKAYESWNVDPGRFQTIDSENLPFGEEAFDTVVCFEVLEHVPSPEALVREMRRVCRKNLIVTVPNCRVSTGMRKSSLTYYHLYRQNAYQFFRYRVYQ